MNEYDRRLFSIVVTAIILASIVAGQLTISHLTLLTYIQLTAVEAVMLVLLFRVHKTFKEVAPYLEGFLGGGDDGR